MLKVTLVNELKIESLVDAHVLTMTNDPKNYLDHIRKELDFRAGQDLIEFMKKHKNPVTTSYRYEEYIRPHMHAKCFQVIISVYEITEEEN